MAVIVLIVALLWTALDIVVDIGEAEHDRMEVEIMLGSYPESIEFKRLYPEYREDTFSGVIPSHYEYELRSVGEDGSLLNTDSLIIEYNADTGESTITYLCIEPDGDRVSYNAEDLAEVMAGICG